VLRHGEDAGDRGGGDDDQRCSPLTGALTPSLRHVPRGRELGRVPELFHGGAFRL